VTQGGSKLFSYDVQAMPDGTANADVDWGHRIRGLDSADTQVADGFIRGTINGREFLPLPLDADPASAVFVDGQPAPQAKDTGNGLKKRLARLDAEIAAVESSCELVSVVLATGGVQRGVLPEWRRLRSRRVRASS